MMEEILNNARTAIETLQKQLEADFTEEILEALLRAMSLIFLLSRKYRSNIETFSGSYMFKGRNDSFMVAALFDGAEMKVHKNPIENPSITIAFKDPAALRNFIFSPKPDILSAILLQDVTLEGNLNYLYKFAYMANHLRLKAQDLVA
jgi:hypothetical protein